MTKPTLSFALLSFLIACGEDSNDKQTTSATNAVEHDTDNTWNDLEMEILEIETDDTGEVEPDPDIVDEPTIPETDPTTPEVEESAVVLTGKLSYMSHDIDPVSGALTDRTRCDMQVDLTGYRAEEECPDCDFTSVVEAEVVRDESIGGCQSFGRLSLWAGPDFDPRERMLFGFAPEGMVSMDDESVPVAATNVLYSSFEGVPYWMPITADIEDDSYDPEAIRTFFGSADLDTSTGEISWQSQYVLNEYRHKYRDPECGYVEEESDERFDTETTIAATEYTVTEEFDCDYTMFDRYVSGTDVWAANFVAGDTVRVSVDTHEEHGRFDPEIVISNDESCLVIQADDSFECTSSVSGAIDCPAAEFTVEKSGTYHIQVSGDRCHDDMPKYELAVDASDDPVLTLIENNQDLSTTRPVIHEVQGTVIIPSLVE